MKTFHKITKDNNGKDTVVYKHNKAVRYTEDAYDYTEYDTYDRVVFYYLKHNGYWCLKFYDDVYGTMPINRVPYNIVHKYWNLYNDLI